MATIGIDLRPMQGLHKFRGIGVYIKNLVSNITHIDKENHYVFYIFGSEQELPNSIKPGANFSYEVRLVPAMIKNETVYKYFSSWRKYATLDLRDVDVLLQPDLAFGLAKGDVPTIGVYYDAIPLIFTEQHFKKSISSMFNNGGIKTVTAHIMNKRTYTKTLGRYKFCSSIIAISKSAKQDLKKYVGYNKEVVIIPLATCIDEQNLTKAKDLKIPKEYVLYVGGGDYRKNVKDALDAFSAIEAEYPSASILLVGRDFEDRQLNKLPEIKEALNKLDNVYSLGYIADENMAGLYKNARLFLFPSLYEGFGIPVLEAMTMGCPVAAYNNSSIPEIVQDAFPLASNKQEFISLALKMFKDSTVYTQRAKRVARTFSWEHTAKKTIELLERAT